MRAVSLSEFADRINEIMPVISREFLKLQTDEFYKTKVTFPQFVVMDFLNRRGRIKMTDLANFLNVTTSAITGIVDRLVRYGYVRRQNDPEDRRIINVRLTAKGAGSVKSISEKKKQVTMKIFGMISQKERDDYLNILVHIQSLLKE